MYAIRSASVVCLSAWNFGAILQMFCVWLYNTAVLLTFTETFPRQLSDASQCNCCVLKKSASETNSVKSKLSNRTVFSLEEVVQKQSRAWSLVDFCTRQRDSCGVQKSKKVCTWRSGRFVGLVLFFLLLMFLIQPKHLVVERTQAHRIWVVSTEQCLRITSGLWISVRRFSSPVREAWDKPQNLGSQGWIFSQWKAAQRNLLPWRQWVSSPWII